jgi:hypothetical protein
MRDDTGFYCVVYTARHDIELAKKRFIELMRGLR